MPASDDELFEGLIRQLRAEGHEEPADRLHSILHETAWTTGSELLGEIGLAIRDFTRTRPEVSSELRRQLKTASRRVGRMWPVFW